MCTSTRLIATRLPNRVVTCCASRTAMFPLALWRQFHPPMRACVRANARMHTRAPGSTQRQRRCLAFADWDKLTVLHLDQGALLDGITGMFTIGPFINDGNLPIGAGEARKILDLGQFIPYLLAILRQTLGGILDLGCCNGLCQ